MGRHCFERAATCAWATPQVFLDVDDLESTALLEEYISQSAVVLIFLSRGYFLSINCLREVRAAVEMQKPIILVHESDASKGGASLDELRAECPEELREAIFGGHLPVPWLRLGHFQKESLICIAEGMLAALPTYANMLDENGALDLYMPGASTRASRGPVRARWTGPHLASPPPPHTILTWPSTWRGLPSSPTQAPSPSSTGSYCSL